MLRQPPPTPVVPPSPEVLYETLRRADRDRERIVAVRQRRFVLGVLCLFWGGLALVIWWAAA